MTQSAVLSCCESGSVTHLTQSSASLLFLVTQQRVKRGKPGQKDGHVNQP